TFAHVAFGLVARYSGVSHYPIFRPRMPAAGLKFLEFFVRGLMNGLRIVSSVDVLQERNHLGISIADAANLEEILVDVDNMQLVFPEPHLAKLAQLRAGSLEKGQGGLEAALGVVVNCQRLDHAKV